jgi:hypothetical protein
MSKKRDIFIANYEICMSGRALIASNKGSALYDSGIIPSPIRVNTPME